MRTRRVRELAGCFDELGERGAFGRFQQAQDQFGLAGRPRRAWCLGTVAQCIGVSLSVTIVRIDGGAAVGGNEVADRLLVCSGSMPRRRRCTAANSIRTERPPPCHSSELAGGCRCRTSP